MSRSVRRDDAGAEAVELAVVAPLALLAIAAVLYALLAAAWHVGVAHAATVGVRYATIPAAAAPAAYPTSADVEQHMDEASPFFSSDACGASVTGEPADNAPLTVVVNCSFPNPLGSLVAALTGRDADSGPLAPQMTIDATAHGRRE